MNDSDVPLSNAPPTLEYSGGKAGARMSRLAILAMIVAVAGSPFVLVPLLQWVDRWGWQLLGIQLTWRWRRNLVKAGMLAATVAPVVAIVHIAWSRGKRRGMNVAVVALILCLIWWAFVGLVALLAGGWGRR